MCIWNLQELSNFILSLVRDVSELILSVGEFHDTLARSSVIEHFLGSFIKNGFWKNTRSSREVVAISAISDNVVYVEGLHIHSE
jgi:hypothetical protein